LKKRERGDEWKLERFNFLRKLVNECETTKSRDARRQVLANLANFAYDPINHEFLRALNAAEIFTSFLSSKDDELVEYAIGGLANLATNDLNWKIIVDCGIERVQACVRMKNAEIVISALTTLIYLYVPSLHSSFYAPDFLKTLEILERSDNPRIKNLTIIFLRDCLHNHNSLSLNKS